MKILILNYEFPPVGGGGGEVSAQIGALLAARGHQVRVQTAALRGLPRRESVRGMEVFRAFSFRRRADRCSVTEMAAYLLANFFPVWQQVRRWRPDVLHIHFAVPTGALGWLISRLTGVPYVLTAHLGDVPGGVPEQTDNLFRFLKPFTRPIWRRATRVTAVSDFVRGLAVRAYQVPVETIHNGIVLKKPPPDLRRPEGAPLRLVFAGRFNPQKNLPFLIQVLDGIRDLTWRCDLLGDGPEMSAVKSEIERLDLADRILLHGWRPGEEVERVLAAADVLVMPSQTEGLPVVAVLALCHGLALLGSEIGGLADVVAEGVNGYLIAPGDLNGFRDRLRLLACDPESLLRMRRGSLERAVRFDIERIVDRYEAILVQAASQQHLAGGS